MGLGHRTAKQRTARLILSLDRRLRERGLIANGSIEFPLRYQHVADALGLTPVYANRIISALRAQGVIDLRNRPLSIRRSDELAAIPK